MISPCITAFLAVLGIANLIFLAGVLYSYKKPLDSVTKIGFTFMAVTSALDTLCLYGGVCLW